MRFRGLSLLRERKEAAVFTKYPAYPRYRALRLQSPPLQGEDCYALQTALDEVLASSVTADGVFGPDTSEALVAAQRHLALAADGIAGPRTWLKVVDTIAKHYRVLNRVALGALYGQLQHESGFYGGNYSPQRADGSYDAGVAQRNTAHTPPDEGFNVPLSISVLAKNTRDYYDLFAGIKNDKRRWTLAQGSWNAPAFACYFAKAEGATKVKTNQTAKPGTEAARLFAAYCQSVSAYLRV